MNEADTPNNKAFVELPESSHSPQSQQASCPFYSVFPSSTIAISQLPLLPPAPDKHRENQIPLDSAPQEDWVAEPEREQQESTDSEFKKLLTLNEELRTANNGLYDQVQELQSALIESEQALQWQKKRSTVTESMLNEQTKELTAAQEQIKSLVQQLETAVQTVQRQESLIEHYKAQLEINQQRLAQLERECALIHSNYNEQSHQILQAENACRELRTRLMRQQRQTLQFKAALEKCLETPVTSYDSVDNHQSGSKPLRPSKRASTFTYTQPIKPWGKEPEPLTDDIDDSSEASSTPSILTGNDSTSPQLSSWDSSNQQETLTSTEPTDAVEIEAGCFLDSNNLEEQLDGVIEMFFASHSTSTSSPPFEEKDADNTQAATTIWETTATPITTQPQTTEFNVTNDHPSEDGDYWLETSHNNTLELLGATANEQLTDNSSNPNSPSPLLYPHRSPQKRKSFASVELPNFRRNSQ